MPPRGGVALPVRSAAWRCPSGGPRARAFSRACVFIEFFSLVEGSGGMPLRYISMFSGIECVSLAIQSAGADWEPVCFAETAPFPSAVLAHRFPGVPNVGDITAHDWSQYRGKVDLVAGGSPCQAFSVAGRREGLSDRRGNLTLSFVEAIDAIDPEIVLWENVPGILALARDNSFGCFLGALSGAGSPLVPPKGKRWTNAGVAAGPKRQIAWRVLDARHFGVPQRRRRVFLVAGRAGGWADPAEILFEPESLRGHPEPGEEAGKDPAADSGVRAQAAGRRPRRRG